jgi:hypothetical protein
MVSIWTIAYACVLKEALTNADGVLHEASFSKQRSCINQLSAMIIALVTQKYETQFVSPLLDAAKAAVNKYCPEIPTGDEAGDESDDGFASTLNDSEVASSRVTGGISDDSDQSSCGTEDILDVSDLLSLADMRAVGSMLDDAVLLTTDSDMEDSDDEHECEVLDVQWEDSDDEVADLVKNCGLAISML